MASYESFAMVYDELMDNVPYEKWWLRIRSLLHENGIKDGIVLDLACGTGRLTRLMSRDGYDMIGVDRSVEMLQIARENSPRDCLYLLQDMREFELYGTVRAAVCACDSLNYLTDPRDLQEVFSLVNNYLDPGGIFVFDVNTDYKYRKILGDTVIAEDREDVSFIWFNEYDKEAQINSIELNVFVREEDGRYRKFCEEHVQRGYTMQEILDLLEGAGMKYIAAYDGYSGKEADSSSERIVFVAREYGKQKSMT